ncbi:MAG: VWA domain-containing protein, partial [Caldilineaceae bacterium]|nr:VWA domain-containing protein [Caldilineaceae bacterium]
VVVLDDSGSMATCWPWPRDGQPFTPPCQWPSVNPPSDPDALRYSAARLLVNLADDEDRIAVVRFDAVAGGVGALAALQEVGSPDGRSQLAASLQAPDDYLRRGYTRIDLGLEQAITQLTENRRTGRNQYVLLLTDGEPTQPDGTGSQRQRILEQIQVLRDAGIYTFPVVLCNASAGCSGEFVQEAFAEYGVREAGSAQDLLRVFSEIFAEMKPDRSVLTTRSSGSGGALSLSTRTVQGVRKISLVTPRAGLTSFQLNNEPFLAQSTLDDPNIEVSVVDASLVENGALPDGRWSAEVSDRSGFAVVQAESYPQLVNPPPSLADSSASVRYYPAGKAPLLIGQGVGPGANEPLLYNGTTPMQALGDIRYLIPNAPPREITLQLGTEDEPLQLVRSFRLAPRAGLPKAESFSPTPTNPGVREDGRALLQVGFSAAAGVQDVSAIAYVTDQSPDVEIDAAGNGPLVYRTQMRCADQLCSDEGFEPGDGRTYKVLYIVQAAADEIRFSDWAEAELSLKPAVYMSGLPATLDLAQMPEDGWPIELSAGATEEIGKLTANLELRRVNDDGSESEPLTSVALNFAEDVPETGSLQTLLKVEGLETLRPGQYVGQVTLTANTPAGRPADVAVRPSPQLPVTLKVSRPTARLESRTADFGVVLFDTSPNFRLDQDVLIPLAYEGKPFKLTVNQAAGDCTGVTVTASEVRQQDGRNVLPLRLSSQNIVLPRTCTGNLTIAGPNGDYDVFPSEVNWQVRVDEVEWSIANSELSLGDLRLPGERVQTTLLVRFNGKAPFVIEAGDLAATATLPDGQVQQLTPTELEFPPVEVTGEPNENGLYEVPVTLAARQQIPNDPLRGAYYSGGINLSIRGLPNAEQTLKFNLRSPTLIQRYVAPLVVPVYTMPWALCTWPLTLFLLIMMLARMRGRDFE